MNELSEILEDFSPQVLAKVIERNIIEQYSFVLASLPQFKVHNTEDLVWLTSNIPHPYLNYVLRARFSPDEIDTRIEATLSEFSSRGLPMTWSVGPSSQPSDLGRHLEYHGLTHTRDEIGMAIDLMKFGEDLSILPKVIIKHVVNEEMLREWFGLVTVSFGYSDLVADVLFDLYARVSLGQSRVWQLYIGYVNGKPVGASRLFISAGVAGLYHIATIPEARGHGIGTAMTCILLQEARNRGYRIGVLRAAETARGIYERIGFKEYCPFRFYVWSDEMVREKEFTNLLVDSNSACEKYSIQS